MRTMCGRQTEVHRAAMIVLVVLLSRRAIFAFPFQIKSNIYHFHVRYDDCLDLHSILIESRQRSGLH